MAVSQFLRPGSLMDAVKGCLTPDVVRKASSFVGESESSTRQTLNGIVPSVLSGLTNMASSQEGATSLAGMIRDGGYGAAADNVSSLFSGGGATNNMLSAGQQLLGKIFGGRGSAVTDLVAKSGGVSSSAASKLMALAAPLTLGVLGKRAAAQGLDSSGLANVLLNERSEIAAAAPSGLSQLLGGGPAIVKREVTDTSWKAPEPVYVERVTTAGPTVTPPTPTGTGRRWLPLALIALGALALLLYLLGRAPNVGNRVENLANQGANMAKEGADMAKDGVKAGADAAKGALEKIPLPSGVDLNLTPGSINYNLAHFLGDTSAQDVPKTFVFDHLNFETASTQLTPDSTQTVTDMSSILKAYPNAQVQLVGHTDNTGTPDGNQKLSVDRANAVKQLLVGQGIATDRISTAGFGQDRPLASNDTEDGRAQNRRTELTVTRK